MKKVVLLFFVVFLCGCSNDSTLVGTGTYRNAEGETTTATVTMKNQKIVDVSIDETNKNTTKRKLKDEYQMKQASVIGKEWYEQADYLETYLKDHQIKSIKLDEQGKATNVDIRSGCTISIEGYIQAVKAAMKNAK